MRLVRWMWACFLMGSLFQIPLATESAAQLPDEDDYIGAWCDQITVEGRVEKRLLILFGLAKGGYSLTIKNSKESSIRYKKEITRVDAKTFLLRTEDDISLFTLAEDSGNIFDGEKTNTLWRLRPSDLFVFDRHSTRLAINIPAPDNDAACFG